MKIKEQTRKLVAGCSKHRFEVVDKTDEVSYIYLRQGDADAVLKEIFHIFYPSNLLYHKLEGLLQSFSYSMKIKKQTRKLATDCSKHRFEVVDKTDEVSYIYLRQGEVDMV